MKIEFCDDIAVENWREYPLLIIDTDEYTQGTKEEFLLILNIWLRGLFGMEYYSIYNEFEKDYDELTKHLLLWADEKEGSFVFGVSEKAEGIYIVEVCFVSAESISDDGEITFEGVSNYEMDMMFSMPLFRNFGASFTKILSKP